MYMYCHPLLWNNVLSEIHSKIIYDVLLTIYILKITSQHIRCLEHSYCIVTVIMISGLSNILVYHPLLWNNVLSGIHSKIIYDALLTIYILNTLLSILCLWNIVYIQSI